MESYDMVVFGSGTNSSVPCSSVGDVVVEENGVLEVSGSPVIKGDFHVEGKVNVPEGNTLVVEGNVFLGPKSVMNVDQSADNVPPVKVTKMLKFHGELQVNIFFTPYGASRRRDVVTVVPVVVPLAVGTPILSVPVAQFASSSGSFSSVNMTIRYPNSCDVYSDAPVAAYGASTMSVTVSVARDPSKPECNLAGGLSAGAIAGIAVGSVVGAAVLVAVWLIVWRRKELAARSAQFTRQMAKRVPESFQQ